MRRLNLSGTEGVIVRTSGNATVLVGDVIARVGKTVVGSLSEFVGAIAALQAAPAFSVTITLTVLRVPKSGILTPRETEITAKLKRRLPMEKLAEFRTQDNSSFRWLAIESDPDGLRRIAISQQYAYMGYSNAPVVTLVDDILQPRPRTFQSAGSLQWIPVAVLTHEQEELVLAYVRTNTSTIDPQNNVRVGLFGFDEESPRNEFAVLENDFCRQFEYSFNIEPIDRSSYLVASSSCGNTRKPSTVFNFVNGRRIAVMPDGEPLPPIGSLPTTRSYRRIREVSAGSAGKNVTVIAASAAEGKNMRLLVGDSAVYRDSARIGGTDLRAVVIEGDHAYFFVERFFPGRGDQQIQTLAIFRCAKHFLPKTSQKTTK